MNTFPLQQQLITAWFSEQLANKELCEKLKKIKFVVTDVDGCLTPGNSMVMNGGDEAKEVCIQDGYGLVKVLQQDAFKIAFLTGSRSPAILARAKRLGLAPEFCIMDTVEEKEAALINMQQQLSVTGEETLFLGDDAQDYKVRAAVSLFASPANAVFYVYAAADIQLPLVGGHGAMRLLLDLILYVQGKHFAQGLITDALTKNQ